MVAKIVALDGQDLGGHATYLSNQKPGKAEVSQPKKTKKIADTISGGAIHLFEYTPGNPLVLAEGVETGLAAHESTGWPVWACVSAAGLEAVRVPTDVGPIYIAADLDRSGAGQRAAEKLAERLSNEGRDVRVVLPAGPIPGDSKSLDWLDILNRDGLQAVAAAFDSAPRWDAEPAISSSIEKLSAQTVPPFPLETLPPSIRRFVEEAAASFPAPVDMIAVPALVCVGAAIGSARLIRLKPGWVERPALYAAIVQPPGTLKTPALEKAAAPVRRRQDQHEAEYQRRVEEYETVKLVEYTRALEEHKKGQRPGAPSRPEKPYRVRTWTADVTVERLAAMLAENQAGLVIIRDELSAWVRSLNQYRAGKGADRQFYLSAWSGAAVAVDRQGKDPILIGRPFLAIVGCVPPDVLPELDDEGGREDGFLHRLLFAYPDNVPIRWTDATISDCAFTAYCALFEKLYGLRAQNLNQELPLTPAAGRMFTTWHDQHCRETEDPGLSPALRGFHAKLKGYCARLALIHALCLNPDSSEVGIESIVAAADLVDYFKAHAARVAPLLVRQRESAHERCEKQIRQALMSGRALTRRELARTGNSPARIFNETLDALVRADQLVEVEKAGTRRTLKAYRLADHGE